ncbi:transporter [Nocardia asteroides NBRC 15531]|uniref:ABC transporter substrate-binding protein n=1 Tax=Nocardia asteroides NBRC 15531 TaxID=1110697 RepID=U5EGK4_NOCAS|nr:glycine betaine ABC transporter substrate-binding protein [Nocardia asteroides]TLF70096.1 transporter [Nocardia asteroides NBRC 15531]UGT49620.1 transporter [Nocardia asteroides]SFL96401.1 osmoprotectant transport system substrate-binding protein [Nocardia asteroides]VEG37700.1 Substrate binding domain of ABC-type glycine betaine transport system [Nocardia asteroides]GAD84284.1 putative ABC transporter substrate-binding protein [Nocardia asteroides NBRC 15531]
MVSRAVRRAATALLVVTCAFGAVSCAGDEPGTAVAVGADSSAESIVLAQVYAQALARAGVATTVVADAADPAADLDAGRITVLPARSGALLDRWHPAASARTPEDVVAAVNAALPAGLSVSDPADGTDLRSRMLVTPEFAARENLGTVAALTSRCAEFTAGAVDLPGLDGTATAPNGCAFATTTRYPDLAALRQALRNGEIQVGIVDGPPADAADLVVLDDPKYAVRAQNLLALYRSGQFDRIELKKLNYVAGELTTEGLLDLVAQVESGTDPATAARRWLDEHGL